MRRNRQTKILATLGPASRAPEQVRALFEAGADVFRLNFSHGSHEDHRRAFAAVRAAERAFRRPVGVLADLQGPKLRVGSFAEGAVLLTRGAAYRFDLDPAPGDGRRAGLPHPEIFAVLRPGMELLADDGRMRFRVERCDAASAELTVLTDGKLSDHKGVNVPGAVLPIAALTEKDRRDLAFALDLGVDWVALSFVQQPSDVAELRKLVAGRAACLVKLEKPAAIERLEEIVELADGAMVARGDLGVELPPEEVPVLQKRIVLACRAAGKPVVVATQMLESMTAAPSPTRAEASDVATAVYEGADAVMLSAESATGQYPLEAVQMMNRIIERVERAANYRKLMNADRPATEASGPDAIAAAAHLAADTLSAAAIVTYTTSGSTALRLSRERPATAILGLTPRAEIARRLALAWGLHSVHTDDAESVAEMVERACEVSRAEGFARVGQRLVITAGMPFGTPGATNLLRIAHVAP